MRYLAALCVAMMGVAVLAGCEEKKDQTATPPSAPPATKVEGAAAGQTNVPTVTTPAPAKSDAGTPAAVAPDAKAAADAAAAKAEALSKDANSKLEEVMNYVKEKKYDLADELLKKLEANKASLPEAIRPKIEQARTALNAAKAVGEGKVPAIPGLGK